MPLGLRFFTDRSDLVLVAAVALLPVDGTVIGIYAPFWTPISPWLFLLHTAMNWKWLPAVYRRFRMFFWLPALLVVMSVAGWMVFGFHPLAAAESLLGVVGALARHWRGAVAGDSPGCGVRGRILQASDGPAVCGQ